MIETNGDLWDYYDKGYWVIVPTNGMVNFQGNAVMGKGVAKQAVQKVPTLSQQLGQRLNSVGNQVFCFHDEKIITFPTKNEWWLPSTLELVIRSTLELEQISNVYKNLFDKIVLPRVGCGLGQLSWTNVAPVLHRHLDDRFTVVNLC
jgi:hypothetical protein